MPPVSGEAWSVRIGRARYMPMPSQPACFFLKQSKATSIRGMSPPPKGQWGHCTRNHQACMPGSATTGGVEASACFFQNRVRPSVCVECLHHPKGSGDLAQGIIKPLCQGVPEPEVQNHPPRWASARSEPGAPINFFRPSSMHPNGFAQPLKCSKHQR